VATYSTVLGLKLNDESDPFQLSDFTANYQILDAAPGTFICTSTTRPTWGANQNGRLIFMSDLKQLSYWNNSTGWTDLRDSVPIFAGGYFLNAGLNPGSTSNFGLLTFTTPRPSALAIIATANYTYTSDSWQVVTQSVTFDGSPSNMGGFSEQVRIAGDPYNDGGTVASSATSLAVIPSVSAGQHTIGIKTQLSHIYFSTVDLQGVKIIAFISTFASGNAL
jgi:hypothetical protein